MWARMKNKEKSKRDAAVCSLFSFFDIRSNRMLWATVQKWNSKQSEVKSLTK